MRELKLTQINIYPIKSLGGISLSSARVMPKGLQYDRRWMLVDSDGVCLTQRVHPTMALFKLAIEEDHLVVNHKENSLTIPIDGRSSHTMKVTIWDDVVSANEVSQ